MTDATPPAATPGPRPGSLEHLADQDPSGPAVVHVPRGQTIDRREHDTGANALAHGLRAEHAVGRGVRVALQLPAGPDLLLAQYALAKLGAAPLLLSTAVPRAGARALAATAGCALLVVDGLPDPAAPDGGPAVLPAAALPGLIARHADAPRLLTTDQTPVAGVQATDPTAGPVRLVVRERDAERIARLAPTVGDLLGRVGLPAGGVHLLSAGADRPEPQFWAAVALITGGSVVTAPSADPAALLEVLAEQQVTSTVMDAATLRALSELPAERTDEADLTALQRIVVDGGPLDAALMTAAADLFGDDVVHRVDATTQTGPYAHAGAEALLTDPAAPGLPLTGVALTTGPSGETLVSSPLGADGALGGPAERGGWPAPPAWTGGAIPLR